MGTNTSIFTLQSLIDDILEEARNGNVAESESITRQQVEYWIHSYRAMLIKQDLDKGRYTNPQYIQSFRAILPSSGGVGDIATIYSNIIPNAIDLHYKSGITSIRLINGTSIQLMPKNRAMGSLYKRYGNLDTTAYRIGNTLYVVKLGDSEEVVLDIDGIWEDPTEVPNYDASLPYPIPVNMIPTLKELIFQKEFKTTLTFPTDDRNNSNNDNKNVQN